MNKTNVKTIHTHIFKENLRKFYAVNNDVIYIYVYLIFGEGLSQYMGAHIWRRGALVPSIIGASVPSIIGSFVPSISQGHFSILPQGHFSHKMLGLRMGLWLGQQCESVVVPKYFQVSPFSLLPATIKSRKSIKIYTFLAATCSSVELHTFRLFVSLFVSYAEMSQKCFFIRTLSFLFIRKNYLRRYSESLPQ